MFATATPAMVASSSSKPRNDLSEAEVEASEVDMRGAIDGPAHARSSSVPIIPEHDGSC
ncbi:MAG: hypothetical protein ACN6QU_24680 [Paraburkholderia terricola]